MPRLPLRSAIASYVIAVFTSLFITTLNSNAVGQPFNRLPRWLHLSPSEVDRLPRLRCITYSPDQTLLITTGADQSILWNASNKTVLQRFPGSYSGPAFASDNSAIAIGGRLYVQNTTNKAPMASAQDPDKSIVPPPLYHAKLSVDHRANELLQQSISFDNQYVLFVLMSRLEVYRISNGELVRQEIATDLVQSPSYPLRRREFAAGQFTPEGNILAIIYGGRFQSGYAYIVHFNESTYISDRRDLRGYDHIYLSPSGRWYYAPHWHNTGEDEALLRIYNTTTGELALDTMDRERFMRSTHEYSPTPIFLANDTQCIVGLKTTDPFRFDLINQHRLVTYKGLPSPAIHMHLIDDGKVLE